MGQQTDYDVVIVGAAIAGATLMNILTDEDLNVLVLDKELGVLEIPRAAHIDDEVLRYFQRFGIAESLPHSFQPKGRFDFFDDADRMFMSFPESAELDQGYLDGYYFHQPDFERFLRERAVGKGVTLLERHEVFAIDQDNDKVVVTYRDIADPSSPERQVSARYLVACDGGSSFVRKHLGVSMEKLAEGSNHIIVDFTAKDGVKLPEELGYSVWARIKRQGTTIYVNMPKGIKRLEFDVPDNADKAEFESEENVFALLAPWIDRNDVKEIVRANIYSYRSLIADSWMEGRILLAGDAAHLSPPFLGQGACAAVRDVFNLGWKLGRVLKGVSPESLLRTYQSERRPHAAELVRRAGKIGEMFKVIRQMPPEQVAAMPPQVHTIVRPTLGPGLHHDDVPAAGSLGPQPRLSDGRLLDETVHGRFAVVGNGELIEALGPRSRKILEALDAVIITAQSEGVTAALRELGGEVMVVRPDLYLLGVARDAGELERIILGAAEQLLSGEQHAPSSDRVEEVQK